MNIQKTKSDFDQALYRRIFGFANEYKEGDEAIGIAAMDASVREDARKRLSNTRIREWQENVLLEDDLQQLIWDTTNPEQYQKIMDWTLSDLKKFLLDETEDAIKSVMDGLNSDVIAAVVKLMNNSELTAVGSKIFNPLPESKIGARGYMGARIQPNSPTDNIDDIIWQVFNGFSFATGDVVLGNNPVDSRVENIANIEKGLKAVVEAFGLQDILPWCALAHIDVQCAVEEKFPGSVAIVFQSLAGTDDANKIFDLTVKKMLNHAKSRTGKYGFYFETGQGSDFTNGAANGVDMVTLESRKYGFARALKHEIAKVHPEGNWTHVNDVAGFIGPEVFKNREQLVRCCLEDIVMGKLHGLCIGLDVCSTLHMSVSLDDLDWCMDQIMPANPAYLMALPTKNDPMLSYLTTAFQDHVGIRQTFGYKVNDAMWEFFKRIQIIDADGNFTSHVGDVLWVYYQYCLARGDSRSRQEIEAEGNRKIQEIQARGVPLAMGHGDRVSDVNPRLKKEVEALYADAKICIWSEFTPEFVSSIPRAIEIKTLSRNRSDYIAHPVTGEQLNIESVAALKTLRDNWEKQIPDVQIVISDGLDANAIMDPGHLIPYLTALHANLSEAGLVISDKSIVVIHGRVRAGYQIGNILFEKADPNATKAVIHIIGERPGTIHRNYSVYMAAPKARMWTHKKVDHDIARVISGISDTSLEPVKAAEMTAVILKEMIVLGK
ncbi:MAG: ethanolamine ammonia-lyase subunit EutB [Desulfatirhabdiaceae bacterium]